jgi:hypothetical protein
MRTASIVALIEAVRTSETSVYFYDAASQKVAKFKEG